MDESVGKIPATMQNRLVAATDSCVAVGCRQMHDGPTEIHFDPAGGASPQGELVFEGDLHTPSRELSVCSVTNEKLVFASVKESRTRVRVFANHPSEPDCIYVIFGFN